MARAGARGRVRVCAYMCVVYVFRGSTGSKTNRLNVFKWLRAKKLLPPTGSKGKHGKQNEF